jgi:hypothetical protein
MSEEKISSLATDVFHSIIPIIEKEFENLPDSKEMIEKLRTKLNATFQKPPRDDFEFFGGKRFSNDEIRVALFRPLPEQVSFLSRGLFASLSVPKDHSLKKTSSLILTLVYLVHR